MLQTVSRASSYRSPHYALRHIMKLLGWSISSDFATIPLFGNICCKLIVWQICPFGSFPKWILWKDGAKHHLPGKTKLLYFTNSAVWAPLLSICCKVGESPDWHDGHIFIHFAKHASALSLPTPLLLLVNCFCTYSLLDAIVKHISN